MYVYRCTFYAHTRILVSMSVSDVRECVYVCVRVFLCLYKCVRVQVNICVCVRERNCGCMKLFSKTLLENMPGAFRDMRDTVTGRCGGMPMPVALTTSGWLSSSAHKHFPFLPLLAQPWWWELFRA